MYLIIAISNLLNWFAAEYVIFFSVNIPSYLTIFTKYLLKIFAISDSSSTISSFSTNLMIVLAFTLLKIAGLQSARTFCYQSQTLYQDFQNNLF